MEKTVLITGASGKLGRSILSEGIKNRIILTPFRAELDITSKESVENYFKKNHIDEIIHCAAIASVLKCEQESNKAIETNSIGTAHLTEKVLNKKNLRFVYISTDYVYPCTDGNYSEISQVKPFTLYGWTKLGGELSVRNIKNHCIIRTSFFNPENIPFETAFADSFCSKIPVKELAEHIGRLLDSDFVGTINVGQRRISLYDLYKKYKPQIRPDSMLNNTDQIKRAKDSSLDISLWLKIKEKLNGD